MRPSAADAEGAIRFKATVRGAERGNTYTVDGRILDLKGHPRIEGDVTAKLELDASQMPQASRAVGKRDSRNARSSTSRPSWPATPRA